MRYLRFIFIVLITSLFFINTVFLRRTFAVLLCGVLSFNSASCYSFLDSYGKVDAAAVSSKEQEQEQSIQLAVNPGSNISSDDILKAAKEAAQANIANCSGSVRATADTLGIDFANNQANEQIDWLKAQVQAGKWERVENGAKAADLAAQGRFVVVGLKAKDHGHIAVVVKGSLAQGRYPHIVGGALHTGKKITRNINGMEVLTGAMTDDKGQLLYVHKKKNKDGNIITVRNTDKTGGEVAYTPYSEGGLTVNYGWNKESSKLVEYYTPKTEKDMCLPLATKDLDKTLNKECELKPARSTGDPHLFTFDGLKYDLQTSGEFILIKSDDGTFEVQARQVPMNSSISLNSAAAMKVGSDRVALYAQDFPDADTTTPLRVNGKPTNFSGEKLSLNSGGQILRQGNNYIISSPRGEKVLVNLSGSYLDISPFVYNRSGTYSGLLGNVNGKPDDDLQIRGGGNVLKAQSTYGDVNKVLNLAGLRLPGALNTAEKVYFDQLYKEFANSWRVTPKESLFDYPAGKTTKNYADPRFPSQYLTLNMLSPDQIQKARNACTKAKVSQDLIEGCIFDVGFSGLSEFARTTAEISGYVNIVNQLFPRLKIPTPEQTVNQIIERVKPKKTCLPVVGCL